MSDTKQTPKFLNLYTSENGRISLQSYTLNIEDKKTREKKEIEMVRLNKKTNQFVDGYGYQDINKYMDMSAQAFKDLVNGLQNTTAG